VPGGTDQQHTFTPWDSWPQQREANRGSEKINGPQDVTELGALNAATITKGWHLALRAPSEPGPCLCRKIISRIAAASLGAAQQEEEPTEARSSGKRQASMACLPSRRRRLG